MEISEKSRVWIYQSNRRFSDEERDAITALLNDFIGSWDAHGHKLAAAAQVRYNLFIILAVDESVAAASGCSIDKSSNVIRNIEKEFNVELFNRFNLAYRKGDEVIPCSREQFEKHLLGGEINDETIVFDNTVLTKKDLDGAWEVPFKQSWHSRYFQNSLL